MKIVILAAMNKELQLLVSILESPERETLAGVSLFHGSLGNHDIYLASCGIGKVNSALMTFKIVTAISPDIVINSGVAGGAGIPVGTLLVADRVAYHDVWCGPGAEYGEADGFPLFMLPSKNILALVKNVVKGSDIRTGLICSGDKFVSTTEEISFIRRNFPDVCAVDMESASIAQTCVSCGVPFGIIRVVSDTPGEGENISQYENFWEDAPQKTFSAVKTIIESL